MDEYGLRKRVRIAPWTLLTSPACLPFLPARGLCLISSRAQGEVDCVRALLASGADPNLAAHNGSTCLLTACGVGSPRIATLLIRAGAAMVTADQVPSRDDYATIS